MELKSYQQNNGINGTAEDISVDVGQQHNNNHIISNNKSKSKISFATEPVVKLTDVSITFFKNTVLKGLNISVPNAKIYAILGPKNCGKSLILQCIAGLIKPDKGEVRVLNRAPECCPAIGYMPQEISLFDDLTVEETMRYFGQLYDLPLDMIDNKIDFVVESISTNRKNSLVKCLTNNDKVIVSLAVTVLHCPQVLILDEPTVYCDPLLKKSIWKQLKGLCTLENVTIIMSTNHIEEAKHSDMVALIRNGCLIEEQLPKHLSKEFSFNSIEDIFNNLFNKKDMIEKSPELRHNNQNNHRIAINNNNNSFNEINLSSNLRPLRKISSSSAERISALYFKNLKTQLRNIPLLIFQLLYPALAIALFCACIGKNPYEIPVGVYNPDRPSFVSDLILKSFNPNIIQLKYYDSFDTAYDAVRQHYVWALLSFPHNYTRSMLQRSSQACESPEETELDVEDETVEESVIHSRNVYNHTIEKAKTTIDNMKDNSNSTDLEVEEDMNAEENDENTDNDSLTAEDKPYDSDDEDYEGVDEIKPKLMTTIDLYMDNTNLLISGAIKTQVILALKKAKNRSVDMNSGQSYAPPLQIIDPNVYGSTEVEMSEFITPGVVIAVIFLASILFPGLTIIRERKERLLERSTLAGVKAFELIIAHLMIHTLILIAQISFILFCIFIVFELPLIGSVYLVFALIFIQGLNGLVYSITISSFCRNEIHGLIIWLTTFSLVVILGGTFWPLECMPRLAIFLGKFLPQSIAGNGLRSVMSRGWDLSYLTVQLSLLVPTVWIIILFVASIIMFRIRK